MFCAHRTFFILAALAGLICAGSAPSHAQPAPAARAEVSSEDAPEALLPLFEQLEGGERVISIPGARWLQLRFGRVDLGEEGLVRVSTPDDEQDLDQAALDQFDGLTVIFNGGVLFVTIKGDGGTVEITEVIIGLPPQAQSAPLAEELPAALVLDELQELFDGRLQDYIVQDEQSFIPASIGADGSVVAQPESLCGTQDNRVPSSDPRIGRIMPGGCTGWLVDGGKVLTAGHCITPAAQMLQFNVPASLSDGSPVSPGTINTYMIDRSSFGIQNNGVGNDWPTMAIFHNTQTGLTAHDREGPGFTLSNTAAPNTIRITGHGVDGPAPGFGDPPPRNARNQTQQTHSNVVSSHTPSAGNNAAIRYAADTQRGNSGGPVIDAANPGQAVGIHTHGGCTTAGGAKQGTSFRNQALWSAVTN